MVEIRKRKYWNRYKCYHLEDWQNYLLKHPKWQNRTAIEMLEELGVKARAFYKSFCRWIEKEYPIKEEAKIKAILFPPRIHHYKTQRNGRKDQNKFQFKNLDEWISYKAEHSEWDNKSSTEMIALKGEASSFYFLFYSWLQKKYLRQKRLEILKNVFPRKVQK